MDRDTVLVKTELGKEELATRRSLPLDLRHVLILVDGHSTLMELLYKGNGIPNLEGCLNKLKQLALISDSDSNPGASVVSNTQSPYVKHVAVGNQTIKLQLVRMVKDLLGPQAGKIIKKIEEAGDTKEALISVIVVSSKIIRLVIDEEKAEIFVSKAQEILSANK